jgi:hypothetical protein
MEFAGNNLNFFQGLDVLCGGFPIVGTYPFGKVNVPDFAPGIDRFLFCRNLGGRVALTFDL